MDHVIGIGVAAVFLIVIGISAYLMMRKGSVQTVVQDVKQAEVVKKAIADADAAAAAAKKNL